MPPEATGPSAASLPRLQPQPCHAGDTIGVHRRRADTSAPANRDRQPISDGGLKQSLLAAATRLRREVAGEIRARAGQRGRILFWPRIRGKSVGQQGGTACRWRRSSCRGWLGSCRGWSPSCAWGGGSGAGAIEPRCRQIARADFLRHLQRLPPQPAGAAGRPARRSCGNIIPPAHAEAAAMAAYLAVGRQRCRARSSSGGHRRWARAKRLAPQDPAARPPPRGPGHVARSGQATGCATSSRADRPALAGRGRRAIRPSRRKSRPARLW